MMDASEENIAAYWKEYSRKQGRSNDINDLVFINWTRLNPQAAIAGAGGNNVHYAWWAWACHDPEASLAAAIAANSDRVNNVAWGIGEFHPAWLREHFKDIPESGRGNAIQGMMKWDDGENPLESLEFMKENDIGANVGTLKALVRQDPWAALDWVKENPKSDGGGYGGYISDPMQLVVDTMAEEHPEDLARLADQTPSGMLKLKMEAAVFANLLKTDPEAALESAKSTTVPRVAAERLAAIGLGLVRTDPENAFALARDLFAACPDAMNMITWVRTPGSASGSGIRIPGVNDFMETLMNKDPARVMNLIADIPPDEHGNRAFNTISSQWAERDLVGFSEWVNQQTDESAREQGTQTVVNKLFSDGNYPEAADWAMSMKNGANQLTNTMLNWKRIDPDAAREWLENSSLPAEQMEKLNTILNSN